MATIRAVVLGGADERLDGMSTVGDVRSHLDLGNNYAATVNGQPANDSMTLYEEDFVNFAPGVKGGV